MDNINNKDNNLQEDNKNNQLVNKTQKNNTKLALHNDINNVDRLSTLDFFNEQQILAFESFATRLIKSDKSGLKTINDAFAIAMRAQALNLPFGAAVDQIHVISGKTVVGIHIIRALLSKAGITWEWTKQYAPIYEYTDGINIYNDGSFPEYVKRCNNKQEAEEKAKSDTNYEFNYVYPVKWYKDFNGNLYKDYQLNTKSFGIVINKQQVEEVTKQNKIPVFRVPNQPIDFVTEVKLYRIVNGKEITRTSRFSYSDAVTAELTSKDNWKHYLKIMMENRALTYGARDIAGDVLMGCMEITEMKVVNGQDINAEDVDYAEVI